MENQKVLVSPITFGQKLVIPAGSTHLNTRGTRRVIKRSMSIEAFSVSEPMKYLQETFLGAEVVAVEGEITFIAESGKYERIVLTEDILRANGMEPAYKEVQFS